MAFGRWQQQIELNMSLYLITCASLFLQWCWSLGEAGAKLFATRIDPWPALSSSCFSTRI
jgi:hypothetical protein